MLDRTAWTLDRLRGRLGADLPRTAGGGLDLRGANLAGLGLSKADLAGADLSAANLRGVDFQRANLAGACLAGANLREAMLPDTDLSGASLHGADATRSVWYGTIVVGATLSEINWSEARLTDVQLWCTGLAPADLDGACVQCHGLLAADPAGLDVPALLSWLAASPAAPLGPALRAALADRRWQAWRAALAELLEQVDASPEGLGPAALSRATMPTPAPGTRGLSRQDGEGLSC